MKKLLFLVSAAVAAAGSLSAAWTYDAMEGTITDGVWTFGATVKNGTELTVNAVRVAPSEVSPLDFSQPVTDADGTSYTIVKLNPQFGTKIDNWANPGSCVPNPGHEFVGELSLPSSGLKELSVGAFDNCTNMTGTVALPDGLETIGEWAFYNCNKVQEFKNVIPDSVTTLGVWAFYNTHLPASIRLYSAKRVETGVFYDTMIETVYFGPGLKALHSGGWDRGPFRHCVALTNLVFDAAITNAEITGTHNFYESENIQGTIDLSGFKTLRSDWGCFDSAKKSNSIIIGPAIERIDSNFFSGNSGLQSIEFKGKPPKTFTTPIYGQVANNQVVYTYVQPVYSNEWSVYAQDGIINEDGSTFSSDYFDASVRPFRPLVFPYSGGGGGELGDGVFANGVLTLPGGWKFAALLVGRKLTVNECTAAPDDVTPLDFSVRITDDKGMDLQISKLNPKFGNMTYGAPNNNPYVNLSGNFGGDKVGKLAMPGVGLTEISANAFAGCTSLTGPIALPDGLLTIGDGAFAGCAGLTEIENYVPDTVTSIGKAAFFNVPANGTLRLHALVQTADLCFWKAGFEALEFGPAFKTMSSSHWAYGPFRECLSATRISFDPGMSNASWNVQHAFLGTSFAENTGTLDLSGFAKLDGSWGIINAPNVGEVILAGGMNTLNAAGSFKSFSSMTNIIFKGVPPKSFSTPYLDGNSSKLRIATYVPRKSIAVKNDSGKCWLDYSADGAIHHKGTTWAQTHLVSGVDPANRPLLTIEPDGLMLIVK